ncbi:hypothetical protein SteCoe_14039 [Stentor coeruleus]|uniref:Uncharacterized protein n=1 Tax=Stentor coeruleus TaxID=5963 RepID=A0A1R2C6Y6_9CILI|nr:hypothetical protein SteCoe_14039 [Stentor coeruleus]
MSTSCANLRQEAAVSKYTIKVLSTESDNIMKIESLPKQLSEDSLPVDFELSMGLAREKFNKKIRLHELYSQTEGSCNSHSLLDKNCEIKSRHLNLSPTIKRYFALKDNLKSSTENDIRFIKPIKIIKKVQLKNMSTTTKNHKESKKNSCSCLMF